MAVVTIVLVTANWKFYYAFSLWSGHCGGDNDDTDNGEDDSDLRRELRHQHAGNGPLQSVQIYSWLLLVTDQENILLASADWGLETW